MFSILSNTGCVQQSQEGRVTDRATTSDFQENTPDTVSPGFGRVFLDNPLVLSGNPNLEPDADLSKLLTSRQDFVTSNQFLQGSCDDLLLCFEVREQLGSGLIPSSNGRWAFPVESSEFLQVHTFFHTKRILDRFHENLLNSFQLSQQSAPAALGGYDTAFPNNMYDNSLVPYWFGGQKLVSFSNAGELDDINAFFLAAEFQIKYFETRAQDNFVISVDPTIIYHEIGHALNQVMMNVRNLAANRNPEADLGFLFYDEGGAINEGLADYFSYVVNGRTHLGGWGLGVLFNASRPIDEDEVIHAPGISTDDFERLAYPDFLNYNASDQENIFEDVHYAGQIYSHLLVATTEDLMNNCGLSRDNAVNYVLYFIAETLAELGDLSAMGNDANINPAINLDEDNSLEWFRRVRPVDYRRFAQHFAKYWYNIMDTQAACQGSNYPRDLIERRLDTYGLLLFDKYNENGNGEISGHSGTNTSIDINNRVRSVLVSKDNIALDSRPTNSSAFLVDNRSAITKIYNQLRAQGKLEEDATSQIDPSFPYNNSNNNISPGEVIALLPNVFNSSNSEIGGLRILANDWDHVKDGKPCNNFEDRFPLETEGGALEGDNPSDDANTPGNCNYITRDNGLTGPDTIEPVCFIQLNEDDSSKWVVQETFRQSISLEQRNCLDPNNTNDCFVRAIKGADQATYSRIAPQKSFVETVYTTTDTKIKFNANNFLFFEISPWIPPGTKIDCRFRATFTNCSDCNHDSANNNDDYLDYEYSGPDPFKIIHFRFTVID